ncbi:MAG: hypothetical protein HYY22_03485 [Thaumarchaeota archaeon]|nr:hypothetical protein [Nitrososphaerota archaeon]
MGKHTKEDAEEFIRGIKERSNGAAPPLLFTSDELKEYPSAIKACYAQEVSPPKTGRRGRPRTRPVQLIEKGLLYAQVQKTREKNRVVKVEKKVIIGSVEKVKQQMKLDNAYYNLCRKHMSLRQGAVKGVTRGKPRTPAMAEGITNHIWTLTELLSYRTPINS